MVLMSRFSRSEMVLVEQVQQVYRDGAHHFSMSLVESGWIFLLMPYSSFFLLYPDSRCWYNDRDVKRSSNAGKFQKWAAGPERMRRKFRNFINFSASLSWKADAFSRYSTASINISNFSQFEIIAFEVYQLYLSFPNPAPSPTLLTSNINSVFDLTEAIFSWS